jgi:hypothetical protein
MLHLCNVDFMMILSPCSIVHCYVFRCTWCCHMTDCSVLPVVYWRFMGPCCYLPLVVLLTLVAADVCIMQEYYSTNDLFPGSINLSVCCSSICRSSTFVGWWRVFASPRFPPLLMKWYATLLHIQEKKNYQNSCRCKQVGWQNKN